MDTVEVMRDFFSPFFMFVNFTNFLADHIAFITTPPHTPQKKNMGKTGMFSCKDL